MTPHFRLHPQLLFVVTSLVLSSLAGCQLVRPPDGAPEPDYWPTDGWRSAPPETQGFDSAILADALLSLREEGVPVHSVLLIRDGYLLLDADFYPYDRSTVHDLASVTKSVMATLIGIAADQGKLSLDDAMVDFFPGRSIANLDDRKARITVRHLASMTSGLACDPQSDVADLQAMWASDDWVQFSLDRPMVAEPGTKFTYCGPSIHLLSPILQQATGMTALEFAQEYLFGPLGIADVLWPTDPQGYTRGWGDLALFPQDAAKLGLLMLHGGKWDDRQILSEKWVREATTVQTDTNRGQKYGYAWWLPETEDEIAYYSAEGRGGQFVTVIPEMNLVVALAGGGFEDRDDVLDYIGPAIGDLENPLPANPQGEEALRTAVEQVGLGPAPAAVPDLPEMAAAISGQTYVFEDNPLGLLWARLEFGGPSEAELQLEIEGEPAMRTIPVGLDGVLHRVPLREGYVGGAKGEWTDADTFTIEYDEIARVDQWSIRLVFHDDALSFQIYSNSSPGLFTIEGEAE
jgi:CubicO group peptidase (beta-lactamase class C family)